MTITISARNDIVRMVVSMFDAAPGAIYLSDLTAQFEAGITLKTMAAQLSNHPMFTSIYAPSLNNQQFMDLFLANLLDNEAGVPAVSWAREYGVQLLTQGMNRGELMLLTAQALSEIQDSNTPWVNAREALENKVDVANYYSVTTGQSSTSLATLRGVINGVSSNDTTVAAANLTIDAAIAADARTDLIRLYVGMFGAAPGANKLSALEAQLDAGTPIATIATELSSTADFTGIYAASLNNAQFMDLFLANLLDNEVAASPMAWARAYGIAALDSGMNRGVWILNAVELLSNVVANNVEWLDAKAALENQVEVASYYSVTVGQSSNSIATLQGVIDDVTSDDATVAVATAAINQAIANANPGPVVGSTYNLTAAADTLTGNAGDDVFNSTYDAQVTDTLNAADTISGLGGQDRLNISHVIDVAVTPPDALWTGISGIEKVVVTTTGNGAQVFTTGVNFEDAFAASGVDFTANTSGSGAIDITASTFTGTATFTTSSLAGAQTILTGAGATTVNASSTGGALDIRGAGLIGVFAVTTGGGAQTIISTSTSAVTVNATTGAGALTVTTGAGNDTITLFSSDVAGANIITGNAGADSITLVTGAFATTETIVIGNTDSGITLAAADRIVNFVSTSDLLKMGVAGDATAGTGNYVEGIAAAADFTAALAAANTALGNLNGTSAGTELFAFQFDGTNGYLFNDVDSNGVADQVIVLVGITNTGITAADIII